MHKFWSLLCWTTFSWLGSNYTCAALGHVLQKHLPTVPALFFMVKRTRLTVSDPTTHASTLTSSPCDVPLPAFCSRQNAHQGAAACQVSDQDASALVTTRAQHSMGVDVALLEVPSNSEATIRLLRARVKGLEEQLAAALSAVQGDAAPVSNQQCSDCMGAAYISGRSLSMMRPSLPETASMWYLWHTCNMAALYHHTSNSTLSSFRILRQTAVLMPRYEKRRQVLKSVCAVDLSLWCTPPLKEALHPLM